MGPPLVFNVPKTVLVCAAINGIQAGDMLNAAGGRLIMVSHFPTFFIDMVISAGAVTVTARKLELERAQEPS